MKGRIALAGAGIAVAAVVVTALAVAGAQPPAGPTAEGSSSPSAVGTSAPSGEPTGQATSTPPESPDEEAFGDRVVDTASEEPGEFESGVQTRLISVSETEVSGQGIGAVNGPAFDIVLEISNDSNKTIDLSTVVVNAYTGDDRTPTIPAETESSEPFSGSLKPGATVRGRYLFGAATTGQTVRVTVSLGVESGLVVLESR